MTSVVISGAADTVADIVEPLQQLNALGEPTLASLGLGGWTPPGMFQQFFEMLHVSVGMPWWGAIAVGERMSCDYRKARSSDQEGAQLTSEEGAQLRHS